MKDKQKDADALEFASLCAIASDVFRRHVATHPGAKRKNLRAAAKAARDALDHLYQTAALEACN